MHTKPHTTHSPRYISVDDHGCVELCGGKELGDRYLQKLVSCMETVFREKHNVVTALVADVNQYVYKNAGKYLIVIPCVIASSSKTLEAR